MTHLLDTSALLAYALRESGWEQVATLLDNPAMSVGISALSVYEADRRLVGIGLPPKQRMQFAERWASLLDQIVPLDEDVARCAGALRDRIAVRIATVDMLIAASASFHGAILVHRDAHFSAIPTSQLRQLVLPAKESA